MSEFYFQSFNAGAYKIFAPVATPMSVEEQIATIDTAIEVLDTLGWCQHTGTDEHGRVCTISALSKAVNEDQGRWVTMAQTVMRKTGISNIPGWNDEPVRKYEQVIAMLQSVREKLCAELTVTPDQLEEVEEALQELLEAHPLEEVEEAQPQEQELELAVA